jgi:hypothetical protein
VGASISAFNYIPALGGLHRDNLYKSGFNVDFNIK